MENWRNPSSQSDSETSACRFSKFKSRTYTYNVSNRSISYHSHIPSDPNRTVQNSTNYNWRVSSQMEEEINLGRPRNSNIQNHTSGNWRASSEIAEHRNLDRPRNKSTSFQSLDYLMEINNQDSNLIILELIEKLDDFAQFLQSNLEADWIELTISILSKVSSSFFRYNKLTILKTTAKASFLRKVANYVRQLKFEVSAIPDHNEHFYRNVNEFFHNLLIVCDLLSEVTSKIACQIMIELVEDIHQTMMYLENQRNFHVTENTKSNIQTLIMKLYAYVQENVADQSSNLPIDNFRVSNAYPTSDEMLTSNCVTTSDYLVEGKYDNVEHYLAVQFRLLKDIFIASLRLHIDIGLEEIDNERVSTSTVYTDVVFKSIVSTGGGGVGVIVEFSNQDEIENIFTLRSERFVYGELVLFTKDNFSSVFLGRIIDKKFVEQSLVVGFEPEYNNYDLNATYTVIWMKNIYEPYYYGLKALQHLSEVDFPMKKYFVDLDLSVELPGYLDENSIYTIQSREVDLFGNNWPSAEQLKLDFYQYFAFKAVLTQKFSVVQGFPGTGKTYLGLQVVKTLLHENNKKIWYNGAPILIIAVSNQALDTFLEGLVSTTSKIIRIGHNVKNRKLEKFCISKARLENQAYQNLLDNWKIKIKKSAKKIEQWIRYMIQIKERNVIINFTHFEVIDENIKTSWFSRVSRDELRAWLFDGRESQNISQYSNKISEIINDIIEEQVILNCAVDNITSDEELTLSDDLQQTVLLSKSHIEFEIVQIIKKLQNRNPQDNPKNVKKLETNLINLWQTYQYFKMKMSDRTLSQPPTKPNSIDYHFPWKMNPNDRWNLYFYWLDSYTSFVEKRLLDLQYKHREISNNLDDIRKIFDFEIIKNSLVLGITIQTAQRWHTTLQALGCRIVVVEEASKILESQFVVSLTKHCENLILLSDYDKLPLITAKDSINNPNSLMERMENNGMQFHVLDVQHRMSFEISQLLVPLCSIFAGYPSDTKCPSILEIPSSIFFVHHASQGVDEYIAGEYDLIEAKFIINLARYLRRRGCKPQDITILVSYYDQMHFYYNQRNKYQELADVRISNLGEFQSQESKIILLSLMKSNNDDKIGYIKKEISITFALSRAKEYLYMIGNMDILCENSEAWPKIKEVLLELNFIGNYFPLCCGKNFDCITEIQEPEDFDKIPRGICSELCGSALKCGHLCLKNCFIFNCDRDGS